MKTCCDKPDIVIFENVYVCKNCAVEMINAPIISTLPFWLFY